MSRNKPESRTAELVDTLLSEIRTRGLKAGDFFDTEALLCERYAASRPIIREAVGRLRALGLLVSRQRKGLVVGPGTPVASFSSILPFYGMASAENRQYLGQLRHALEIGAIGLAIGQAEAKDIANLAAYASAYEDAVTAGDALACIANDAAFHGQLLAMTGNPLIAGMHSILADYFRGLDNENLLMENLASTTWEHHAIVEAIRRNDTELARTTLRHHLEPLLNTESAAKDALKRA